jgi:EmrB/QacA subfamily drug resistance transporter
MSVHGHPHPRRWQALVVLAISLLVVSIGNTILNVALPTIQEELDASASELQWIVDGYLLVFAGLLLTAGGLGDRLGRRRALLFGLVLFGLASVAASLSTSSGQLIAARALMGVGAAAIMPTTLSVITNIFPDDQRPKVIAIWSAIAGSAVAIGPVAGGGLIEAADWHWVFLVNVPVAVACIAGALALVPESRDEHSHRLDWAGAILSIAALTALIWALIEAPERGWASAIILGAFGAAALFAALFVAWERHTAHPMLEVSVFSNRRFSAASASIALTSFALIGVLYFLTTYLQSVLGLSALDAGVRMLAIAAGIMLAAKSSVRLVARLGTKAVVAAGLTAVGAAFLVLSGFGTDTGDLQIALVLATMGFGMGLAMAPATEAIMGSLPPSRAGVGSAMNDVTREVAGSLGVAVLGSVLASAYSDGMVGAVDGLSAGGAAAASDSVGAAHEVAAGLGGESAAELVAAANQAFVEAMSATASIAAGVALVGALVAARFLPARAASLDRADHDSPGRRRHRIERGSRHELAVGEDRNPGRPARAAGPA